MASGCVGLGGGVRALARTARGALAEWVAAATTTGGLLHQHQHQQHHHHRQHQSHRRRRDFSSGGGPQDPVPIYGTGSSPKSHGARRVTTRSLVRKHRKGEKITVITAYDYPQAKQVDIAGADVVLVGDSAGMVVHGYDTTLPLTLEETLSHCRAAARGVTRALCVGDLPFGCYEASVAAAVESSVRVMKEGAMDAVKMETMNAGRVALARGVVEAGVAVMGHVGLTPQAVSVLGGFRSLGKSAREAEEVYDLALSLQDAGCFSVVLECIPSELAAAITEALDIPTIGIGSGPDTSGQVLVYHDMLGMLSHPHHESVTPKFAKRYAEIGKIAHQGLQTFCQEVRAGAFPCREYSPYAMTHAEREALAKRLRGRGHARAGQMLEDFSTSS